MSSRKVAVLSSVQMEHEKMFSEEHEEAVFKVSKKALTDAGLTRKDVGTVVQCGMDYFDGKIISSSFLIESSGAYLRDESKVAEDGAYAVAYACMRILSGVFDVAIVVAQSKASNINVSTVMNYYFDPYFQRMFGLDDISASALQAKRYMHKYGVTEEQIAAASVKNHNNALRNPYAHRKLKIKLEDVLKSGVLAPPIKLLDASPRSDGACAMVLASEEVARKVTDDPVWIKGMGFSTDAFYLGDRDLADVKSLELAARSAYKMAGIKNPGKQIDVAEVHDAFSYQELMWTELLGFCKRGEGAKLIKEGVTTMDGELPVNPSGGLIATNPFYAAGLIRVAEAALQVKGDAGKRQVKNVNTALAHGATGVCGQGNCVFILGR
jgi:acetyl-CoA C-acetyltransferase